MTIIVNAVQDATDRRTISVTARGLTDGVTVFQMGDGTQIVATAAGGTATVTDHVYAANGTYDVTVLNGTDAGHLKLLPVAAGVAWPASEIVVRYDPEQVPLGVEVTLTGLKSSHVSVDWGEGGAAQIVPVAPGGAVFVDHRFAAAGTYDIAVQSWTEQDTAPDFPIAQPAVVASIDPTSAVVGGADVLMTVTGTKFQPGAVIVMDGLDKPQTQYVSATTLKLWVDPSTVTAPEIVPVGVRNPGGAALSNTVNFEYTAAP